MGNGGDRLVDVRINVERPGTQSHGAAVRRRAQRLMHARRAMQSGPYLDPARYVENRCHLLRFLPRNADADDPHPLIGIGGTVHRDAGHVAQTIKQTTCQRSLVFAQ